MIEKTLLFRTQLFSTRTFREHCFFEDFKYFKQKQKILYNPTINGRRTQFAATQNTRTSNIIDFP